MVRGRKAVTSDVPYELEEIKKGIQEIIGLEVQWNKNHEDKRKNAIYLKGKIERHLFSVKLDNGRIITFTYKDIYANKI